MSLEVGNKVRLAPGYGPARDRHVIFKVVEISDKPRLKHRYFVEPVQGGPRRRGSEEMFEKVESTDHDAATMITFLPPLSPGQVVKVNGIPQINRADLYVVLKQRNPDTVSIARLGGDDGKYWPSIPRPVLSVHEL